MDTYIQHAKINRTKNYLQYYLQHLPNKYPFVKTELIIAQLTEYTMCLSKHNYFYMQ